MSAGPRGPYRARHAPLVRLDAPPPQPGLAGRRAAVRRDVRSSRPRSTTVYDYGMVTALPGVAVGVLLALCPRWPAAAAVLGVAHRARQLRAGHARPGRRPADRHGHPRRPRRRGPARPRGARSPPSSRRWSSWSRASRYIARRRGRAFFYLLVTGAAWGVGTLVRADAGAVAGAAGARRPARRAAGGGRRLGRRRRAVPDRPRGARLRRPLGERHGAADGRPPAAAAGQARGAGGAARPGAARPGGGRRDAPGGRHPPRGQAGRRPGAPALAVAAGRRPRRAARRRDADRAAR